MMQKLFGKQLEKARKPDGEVDLARLEELVVQAYEEAEQDRLRTDRSIGLMVAELSAFQSGLEDTIAHRTAALNKSRKAMREQNARFLAALEHMAQGLTLYDKDGLLVICNPQYLRMYNLPKRFGRPGTTFRQILEARAEHSPPADGDLVKFVDERLALAAESKQSIHLLNLADGTVLSVNHQPLPGGGWVSTHTDVTEVHKLQDELRHLAYYDALTDLPNRNLLLQEIARAFAETPGEGFALLFLDLDGFKTVNDTLGHATGDNLLRQVAARLNDCANAGDIVGRMGGDEFAVLLRSGDAPRARDGAVAIRRALGSPFVLDGQEVSIAASVGIALAPAHGANAEELLRNADLALYAAKKDRRGGYRFFEAAMDIVLRDRQRLEQDLVRALENGEFELHYQPILNLETQTFSGYEALLRWRHPERGMIAPGGFIPVAEELGLIVPIGEWVIRQAFTEAARWPSDPRVAVNVSSIQFQRGNLVAVVMNALAASGLAPHRVEIEITESIFLANNNVNLEILHQLHMLGVRIALDDFGTGYSALSYLLSFPFDKIKIDGSFVRALDSAEGAHAIVRAVSEIGKRMGMSTTAEGIETAEQLRNVRSLGYSEAQGFLISRPIPRDQLLEMMRAADAMPEAPMLERTG